MKMTNDLRVLSLGYTRSLWEDPAQAQGDTLLRLTEYSQLVSSYDVVTHSLRSHGLRSPRAVTGNFRAYATDGVSRLDSWRRMVGLGLRIARQQRVTVIQAQDPVFTGSAAYLVSRACGAPFNICVYGSNPYDPYWRQESLVHSLSTPLARRVLHRAQGIQVDGTVTKRLLAEAGIKEELIAVRPMIPRNITDFLTSTLDPELRRKLTGDGRYRWLVLFVGRLTAQKSLTTLLQVAALTTAERDDVRFICVGDGSERGRLEEKTREMGLEEVVCWRGAAPHQEVAKYLGASDLFLLTSRYEGFARVLMEAAAAGKPIVTTAVSGADDGVIDGESGSIRRINDVDGLSRAVIELLDDPERMTRMGLAGQRHIQSLARRYTSAEQQIQIWHRVAAG
jgi:glycosyltransferase involved in cell wall biosynthesis